MTNSLGKYKLIVLFARKSADGGHGERCHALELKRLEIDRDNKRTKMLGDFHEMLGDFHDKGQREAWKGLANAIKAFNGAQSDVNQVIFDRLFQVGYILLCYKICC